MQLDAYPDLPRDAFFTDATDIPLPTGAWFSAASQAAILAAEVITLAFAVVCLP